LLTVFSSTSYGFDVRRGRAVTVPAGETVDDTLVIAGDNVTVDGTVTGDLIAFARQVTIRGTVKGNVISMARNVEVEGTVEGSVLGFAQSVETRGQVARTVYAFAQTIDISRDARVDGNAAIFGAEAGIEGTIGKDAFVAAGSVDIAAPARVVGNFTARVSNSQNVRIAPGATIGGKTDIRATPPAPNRYATISFYVWQTIWLAAAFLTGLILFWLAPAFSRMTIASSRDLLISAGVGLLALIAAPVAACLVAITLIGLPLGIMTVALWIIAVYLAKIAVAAFVGRSLLEKNGGLQPAALVLLAGLIPIFIAVNLPFVGSLVNFLLVVLGLGMLTVRMYQTMGSRSAQAA
jgi:cytoskeletal protein CcmA (bactofilin family)